MTGKKWFLIVAATAFVGWIAYLGYAVAVHRLNPPDLVSRSQLVEAECVLVVEVTLTDGKPTPTAVVTYRLTDFGPEPGATATVVNLPQATTPTNAPLTPGPYLLFLVGDGFADPRTGPYRLAGWPSGLGESKIQPGYEFTDTHGEVKQIRPPLAHPWSDSVQKQMKGLGYKW